MRSCALSSPEVGARAIPATVLASASETISTDAIEQSSLEGEWLRRRRAGEHRRLVRRWGGEGANWVMAALAATPQSAQRAIGQHGAQQDEQQPSQRIRQDLFAQKEGAPEERG